MKVTLTHEQIVLACARLVADMCGSTNCRVNITFELDFTTKKIEAVCEVTLK